VFAAIRPKKASSPMSVRAAGVEIDTCSVEETLELLGRMLLKDPLGSDLTEQWHDRACLETGDIMPSIRLPIPLDGVQHLDSQFRAVLDTIPALVWVADRTGAAVYINQRWLEYTGLSDSQALGWNWTAAVHHDDLDRLTEYWRTVLASGEPGKIEARLRRFDGRYRWFLFSASPLRDGSGELAGWCGSNTDIDDRHRAEEAARAAERDLRLILDHLPALVTTATPSGAIDFANRPLLDYVGATLEELQDWPRFVDERDRSMMIERWSHSLASGEPFGAEFRLRRADGISRWFRAIGVEVRASDGTIVRWHNLIIDIDDRKRAEDALRHSEAYLREVQRLSSTGGWRYDIAADLVESSPEIKRVYAIQPGEDASRPPFWFGRIHPDDRPRIEAHFARCLREKTEYRATYRIVLPDGAIRFQYAVGQPITNDAGELVEIIGAQMDMTEHWLATTELERASEAVRDLQMKMSRAAQIATVGELAGSIAHEVNQPLAAVVANAHACLRWLAADPPNVDKAVEAARRIADDGKDAGEVVRKVRSLFRRAPAEKTPLDLNEVVREVLLLFDSSPARQSVAVETSLDPALPLFTADRVQLQQLLLNLLLNALDAMVPVTDRPKQLSIRSTRTENDEAVIEIADNGVGLDSVETAFEPFFTTKAEGMGLGLAICRSIVAAHSGALSAARNARFGTTFKITLPLHPDAQP
jgi:PAS domain S-box-containing protein